MRPLSWSFILLLLGFVQTEPIGDVSRFCESYVECAAVALLEERLCHGNTLKRPFWLPERKDPHNCHQKLKNDYKTIEKMEIDMDNAFLACLTENAQPMSYDQKEKCTSSLIFHTPHFSFGRSISYIPTNCFTGIEKRKARECSTVKNCCGTYDRCAPLLTNSTTAKTLEELRVAMRNRARECEQGKPIDSLPEPSNISLSSDLDKTWAPSGFVNVNFNDLQSQKNRNGVAGDAANGSGPPGFGPLGNVNVKFATATKEQLAEDQAKKILLRQGDGPKLKFPDIPTNLEEHDKKFDKALENTNKYKANTSRIANEGLESLVEASRVSQATEIGTPSGSVHHVEMIGESDNEIGFVGGNIVTSRPLILVAKAQRKIEENVEIAVHGTAEGCRAYGAKTANIEKILGALGEKEDSRDMSEIRALINDWHNNFRKRLLTAKQRSKDKKIMEELEKLVKHFDDVNLKLIKSQVDAGFQQEDYPTEDAKITGNECNPLPTPKKEKDLLLEKEGSGEAELEVDEEEQRKKETQELLELVEENERKEKNGTTLVDEHGDELLVDDDGLTKVLFPGEPDELNGVGKNEDAAEEKITNWINEEYRQEMEKFHKERISNSTDETPTRNDTICDSYMRCRSQMHLAVDGCAWRFAAADVLSSLAESSESLLYRDEGPCDPKQQPLYEQLYEMLIKRNSKLRNCLDKRNDQFFSDSVCLPYSSEESKVFEGSLKRVLKNEYQEAVQCYHDANRIQEKCIKLRDCCPNFDECREETIDTDLENSIISVTARINEGKQECIREKARDAFKKTVRGLLSRGGLSKLQKGQLGLDIRRGARLLRLRR